jgi:hypothetical protein
VIGGLELGTLAARPLSLVNRSQFGQDIMARVAHGRQWVSVVAEVVVRCLGSIPALITHCTNDDAPPNGGIGVPDWFPSAADQAEPVCRASSGARRWLTPTSAAGSGFRLWPVPAWRGPPSRPAAYRQPAHRQRGPEPQRTGGTDGHDSERAAMIYLHSSRERQRALADAVGEAARAELAKSKERKTARPSCTQMARNRRWPTGPASDQRPDRDSNAGPTA